MVLSLFSHASRRQTTGVLRGAVKSLAFRYGRVREGNARNTCPMETKEMARLSQIHSRIPVLVFFTSITVNLGSPTKHNKVKARSEAHTDLGQKLNGGVHFRWIVCLSGGHAGTLTCLLALSQRLVRERVLR